MNGMTAGTTHTAPLARPLPQAVAAKAVATAPVVRAAELRRHVWTGQLEIGQGNAVLTALLGSCVGIAILWRRRGVVGLAHCLLPEGVQDDAGRGGRYVSTAVPALLAAMGVRREQYGEVEVVIAGGARMLRLAGGDGAIGRRNILAAHAHLAARGLRVSYEDVGGYQGRRMSVDCGGMRVAVEQVADVRLPDAQAAGARLKAAPRVVAQPVAVVRVAVRGQA